jgi:hypothetical protein
LRSLIRKEKMKSFLKSVGWIVLFFVVATGILYGLRNINRKPSVLLTDTVCQAPCWAGIRPGKTTYQQVNGYLSKVETIDQTTINENFNKDGSIKSVFWYFARPGEDSAGSVYFTKDQVTTISILTIGSLNLVDIIEKLGPPVEYWSEIGTGEDREYADVFLLYPEKGVCLNLVIDVSGSSKTVTIKEKTPIYRVTYFDPKQYQDLIKTELIITVPYSIHNGMFQTWPGYGPITIVK